MRINARTKLKLIKFLAYAEDIRAKIGFSRLKIVNSIAMKCIYTLNADRSIECKLITYRYFY